jgi:hypothetical protein
MELVVAQDTPAVGVLDQTAAAADTLVPTLK